jgi:hypothetical protein
VVVIVRLVAVLRLRSLRVRVLTTPVLAAMRRKQKQTAATLHPVECVTNSGLSYELRKTRSLLDEGLVTRCIAARHRWSVVIVTASLRVKKM